MANKAIVFFIIFCTVMVFVVDTEWYKKDKDKYDNYIILGLLIIIVSIILLIWYQTKFNLIIT